LAAPIDILVVEDSAADAQLTLEALRDARVSNRIHVARDGEEALSFLCQEPPHANAPRPDIILLDLNLPKIDGRAVLERIKSDPTLKDIPVIVLSVSSNPADVEKAYHHQAAGYITKRAELDQYFTSIRLLKELWLNVMTVPKTAKADIVR
jgi:CheY-like chemotaxis protein